MVEKLVYSLDDEGELSELGAKAYSLMQMRKIFLPVPDAYILASGFFADPLAELKSSEAWHKVLIAESDALLKASCDQCKEIVSQMSFAETQGALLRECFSNLFSPDLLYAVRSSSPEEDLDGLSFAGGYETILGVPFEGLEKAVMRAFASCLDYRVLVYKRQHGLDWRQPKIAVLIQEQIASEVSGVAFSINPLNNDYDEIVVNSNFGLGETVVSGAVNPDVYVISKNTKAIISQLKGKKEVSVCLNAEGGSQERKMFRSDEFTLSGEQLKELSELVIKVEEYYGKPMDIEWAFASRNLHLLQARPITGYVPLAETLITAPSARRRLYLDATISIQGLYKPISPMGTSFLQRFLSTVSKFAFGKDLLLNVEDSPIVVESGRLYGNLSNLFAIFGKAHGVKLLQTMDPIAAEAIDAVDEQFYKTCSKNVGNFPFRLAMHTPELFCRLLCAGLFPVYEDRACRRHISLKIAEMRTVARKNLSFSDFSRQLMDICSRLVFCHTLPRFLASRFALEKIKEIIGAEAVANSDFAALEKALANNPTVEMGMALYRLSQLLPEGVEIETFMKRLDEGDLPEGFISEWRNYLETYGHRCVAELDMASPRYRDEPRTLIEQLISLRLGSSPEENPEERFERCRIEREEAYRRLSKLVAKKSGVLAVWEFKSLYKVYETLAGYREMHKFLLIFMLDLHRQRVLNDSQAFLASGRLAAPTEVFDLEIEEFSRALADKELDLQSLRKKNRVFHNKLAALKRLPQVIDSRGRIINPPERPVKEGEVRGTAISFGIVRGPVKVLHSPDEKPLLKGEILVARATDPGWTPLFVNAAAVILEIGGMLQHGALVAREYGLPCVAGIIDATELWEDGTIVEVDGGAGIVRTVSRQHTRG